MCEDSHDSGRLRAMRRNLSAVIGSTTRLVLLRGRARAAERGCGGLSWADDFAGREERLQVANALARDVRAPEVQPRQFH
jgi:hypothetical protein